MNSKQLLLFFFLAWGYGLSAQPTGFLVKHDSETLKVATADPTMEWTFNEYSGFWSLTEVKLDSSNASQGFEMGIPEWGQGKLRIANPLEIGDFELSNSQKKGLSISRMLEYEKLTIRQELRFYPNVPVFSVHWYFKGSLVGVDWVPVKTGNGMQESLPASDSSPGFLFHLKFPSSHWEMETVQFRESTDHHNEPVTRRTFSPFWKQVFYEGNLLLAKNLEHKPSFFLLKYSPHSHAQSFYPGFDFSVSSTGAKVWSTGVNPDTIGPEWAESYPVFVGLSSGEDLEMHLIQLQMQVAARTVFESPLLLANTWGDRSRDSRMNADFIRSELEKAARLGIKVVQLDDGWQAGLSKNSAQKSGQKWDDWKKEDWEVHPERFPEGLDPLINYARENGLELGIWFNPSKVNSYIHWERDADIILSIYREYGVRQFKVDGLEILDRLSEVRIHQLLQKVKRESQGKINFNLDVTAGNRLGFIQSQAYGHIFMENRYTDWGNYYPHLTLKNLWNLAHFIPLQAIQAEFLNTDRNPNVYPESDYLAPQRIGLRYAFWVAAMAQPLAWMELSGLSAPNESILRSSLLEFSKFAEEFQRGVIRPILQEPNGFSWTGFRSWNEQTNREIYVVFKEKSENETQELLVERGRPPRLLFSTDSQAKLDWMGPGSVQVSMPKPFQILVFSLESDPNP
ncbi:alpha-galactosidase [Algoriphagus confluentis]|uniref:Alpha-galactosidase n=1 Tax=Algoriphagus confluentis TaxID=1697556 RepID=A0ABQ6PIV5_9BACT|nr:hypothetical protein Aconfl_05180 [Algoriphagus confluentis]